jgi:hygromycin-B 7''-O-kinase
VPELASAVGRRYGLAVEPLGGGVANSCYALGDALVLRIPRDASFAADLAREALVVPLALAAGVPTSTIVESTPEYLVQTRLPGVDAASGPVAPGFYEQVGAGLAALHTVTDVPGLAAPAAGDPLALVASCAAGGLIDRGAADWLAACFDALRRPPLPPVLLHGDVAAQNLMATAGGRFAGFVDWGDAHLADPATEFAKLPLPVVGQVLAGYLGTADAGDWPARILWHHLHWALGRLVDPAPVPGVRHWTGPPYARLLGLLRFFASSPPAPWSKLLP